MNPQTDRAAAIVEQYGCKTENLIAILQDIQAAYNYLSEANLTLVADRRRRSYTTWSILRGSRSCWTCSAC